MLRRLIGATLPLAVLAMLASADLFAQDRDKKGPVAKDSATLPAGEYTGTVKLTPATDRTFTITLETKRLVPGTGRGTSRVPVFVGYPSLNTRYNALVSAQTKYVQAVNKVNSAKGPKSLQTAQANLVNAESALVQAAVAFKQTAVVAGILNTAILNNAVASKLRNVRVEITKQDIEFQAMEESKVRTKVLPEQFDEKGNVKKYTKAELAELRGKDKNLEGYESSLEKLEAGQQVKVVLAAVKKKVDADKDKPKEDKEKDTEKKMQAKMIVILAEADPDKGKKKGR
jgi:hypothetical protein